VPLVEWLRVDEKMCEQIRRRELSALAPMQTLETSARLLVNQGVTSEKEFKRVFGL
jgi:type II secretory ATPase GspE/PulE/Tfp pilus assembly ATPase PilB-like protein